MSLHFDNFPKPIRHTFIQAKIFLLGKDSQTYFTVTNTSSIDLRIFFRFVITLFILNPTFSMGLKSGDCGRRTFFGTLLSSRYFWVVAAVWGWVLSSMKKKDCQLCFLDVTGMRLLSKTETYFWEFIVALICVKESIPSPVMHPPYHHA